MTLIGLSVLTTYQHHFIDLPTGLAVGFGALWGLPDEGQSPLSELAFSADRSRRRIAVRYALGAIALIAVTAAGGAWLWLAWPAISLALVSLNYAAIGARGFQKGANGRLSVGARGLLAPYIAGAWINSRLWTRRHPLPAEVVDGVWIGRVPAGRSLAQPPFRAVVDLAAELPCAVHDDRFYRSLPVLDLTVPDEARLRDAAGAIEEGRTHGLVLVCCALGYSRSASAVVAWLLTTGRAQTVVAAMSLVRDARPSIVLNSEHRKALGVFA
jgi:hypothetical protein